MIFEIFIVLIGTIFALISLKFWTVSFFYQIYRPILFFVLGYLVGVGILWIFCDIAGRIIDKKNKTYSSPDKFARNLLVRGITFINYHARIKLTIKGKEKMPLGGRFLIVANHKSKFDPMIITSIYGKKDIAFLMKKENMKIPLGGRLMHRCCYLPLDREDKLQSLEQMKAAQSLIENNISSVGVFPEGTRMPESTVLGEFHEGVFNIAIKAKCPIVVVTFKNTEKIHKNFPLHSTKVVMKILCTIPCEHIEEKTAKQVSDEIHELMINDLK